MADDRPTLAELGITPAVLRALETAGLVVVPCQPSESMLREAWAEAAAEDASGVWREMIAVAKREIT